MKSQLLRATWGTLSLMAVATAAAFAQAPGMDGLESVPRPRAGLAQRGTDLIGFAGAANFNAFFSAGKWESERDEPSRWSLKTDDFQYLVMPTEDDSVQIGHKVGPLDSNANPVLRLKIRIDKLPPGADLSNKKKEDAAFRIFVVFDKKDGPVAPNTIGYAWSTANEPGAFIRSSRSLLKNVWYVVLGRGAGQAGQWITAQRNIADDYRRAFNITGPVPRVVAIGLKADSNDTETQGLAALAEATLGQ